MFSNKKQIYTSEGNSGFLFFPKSSGGYEIDLPKDLSEEFEIEFIWKYKSIKKVNNA